MADEMTTGEIKRTFDRQDAAIRATNDRVTQVAGQMVPATQYEIAHQALIDRVARLEKDVTEGLGRIEKGLAEGLDRVERTSQERRAALVAKDSEFGVALEALKKSIEARSEFTWQRILAVLSILAVLGAAWYTALHQGGR